MLWGYCRYGSAVVFFQSVAMTITQYSYPSVESVLIEWWRFSIAWFDCWISGTLEIHSSSIAAGTNWNLGVGTALTEGSSHLVIANPGEQIRIHHLWLGYKYDSPVSNQSRGRCDDWCWQAMIPMGCEPCSRIWCGSRSWRAGRRWWRRHGTKFEWRPWSVHIWYV